MAKEKIEHKFAVIFATDVVGYTTIRFKYYINESFSKIR